MRFLDEYAMRLQGIPKSKSLSCRKKYATGQKWTLATIANDIQKQLDAKTNKVWLSDDTLIKMMIHHPELDLLPLFNDVQNILDNAIKIVKKDELNVVYFTKNGKNYITTIKTTKDRSELYLTTIYKATEQEFNRQMKKLDK